MLRKQRKKRTIVVGHVVLYRCFTVVSWGDAVLYCFFTDVSGGQKLNKYTICIVVLYLLLMLYCCTVVYFSCCTVVYF